MATLYKVEKESRGLGPIFFRTLSVYTQKVLAGPAVVLAIAAAPVHPYSPRKLCQYADHNRTHCRNVILMQQSTQDNSHTD